MDCLDIYYGFRNWNFKNQSIKIISNNLFYIIISFRIRLGAYFFFYFMLRIRIDTAPQHLYRFNNEYVITKINQ